MLDSTQSPSTTSLILGSAAIGALVSSVIAVIGQYFERKSRRRELLLSESVKLAMANHDAQVTFAKAAGSNRFIPEHVSLLELYYVATRHLLLNGRLPRGKFKTDPPEDREAFSKMHCR